MVEFSNKDITNFLKQFLEIGGSEEVDETSKVYHINKDKTKTLWTIPVGTPAKELPITIYDVNQVDPNVIIVNPFAEGLTTSEELLWFYNIRSTYLSTLICKIVKRILNYSLIAANKKKKVKDKEDNEEFSPEIIKVISPFVGQVDDKMDLEFTMMYDKISNFCNIVWFAKNSTCSFRCGVFENNFKESFGKRIRVKTWEVITNIIKTMFSTPEIAINSAEDLKKTYNYKSDNIGCTRIDAYTHLFMKIMKKLDPYLVLVDLQNTIDYATMDKHLEMIPYYYSTAKNMINRVISKAKTDVKTVTSPPWQVNPMPTVSAPVTGVGSAGFNPISEENMDKMVNRSPIGAAMDTTFAPPAPVVSAPVVVPTAAPAPMMSQYTAPQPYYPPAPTMVPQYAPAAPAAMTPMPRAVTDIAAMQNIPGFVAPQPGYVGGAPGYYNTPPGYAGVVPTGQPGVPPGYYPVNPTMIPAPGYAYNPNPMPGYAANPYAGYPQPGVMTSPTVANEYMVPTTSGTFVKTSSDPNALINRSPI